MILLRSPQGHLLAVRDSVPEVEHLSGEVYWVAQRKEHGDYWNSPHAWELVAMRRVGHDAP